MSPSMDAEYRLPPAKTPEKSSKKTETIPPRIKKLLRVALVGVAAMATWYSSSFRTEKETHLPHNKTTGISAIVPGEFDGSEPTPTLNKEIIQDELAKNKTVEKSLDLLQLSPVGMPEFMKHL